MIPMPRLKEGVRRPFKIKITPSFTQLLKKNEQLRVAATK